MKAVEAKLLGFLQRSPQFIIPIYQRTYSWTERECQQLWEDLLRTGRNEKAEAHHRPQPGYQPFPESSPRLTMELL